MHVVNAMGFFVTLGICIALTTLISRILIMATRRRGFSFGKLARIHGISLGASWVLFIIWCSTATKIYWFAGHVAFAPQALWFIYDILNSPGGEADEMDGETVEIEHRD